VELAEEFAVSRERVRQIEVSAFEKVQNAVNQRVAAGAPSGQLWVVTMGCAVLGSPCRAGTAHVMLFRPIGIERRNNEVTPERPDLAEEAIVVFCRHCRNW
jgi:hypothetical protein